jgi:hypothetical protein
MSSNKESNNNSRPSFTSRIANTISNSPILRRWSAGKASPKPQPNNPFPRGNSNYSFQGYVQRGKESNRQFDNKHFENKGFERQFDSKPKSTDSGSSIPQKSTTPFIDTASPQAVQNQPPKTYLEKGAKLARNAGPRMKKMSEGFKEAVVGGISSLKNPELRGLVKQFAMAMSVVLVLLYSGIALLAFVYAPIFLFAWFWLPGILLQTLALVPLWAFNITRKRYPLLSNRLFLSEFERLNQPRAKELSQSINQESGLNKSWTDELYHDLRTSWHFTRFSLLCSAFSIIPILGPLISYLGQLWIVSDKMGWNLLSVYTLSAKKMSYRQQKHWMRARKWRVVGFTLPYCLLASIPVIGPFFMILAQAAIAHLHYHLLSKEGETEGIQPEKKAFVSAPESEKKAI